MAMRYVKIFFDWPEATSELSFEEKGRLIDAIVAYAAGEKCDLTGNERFIFPTFKIQIDRDVTSYDEISEKRRSASFSRWNRNKANANVCTNTTANDCKCKQDKDHDQDINNTYECARKVTDSKWMDDE